MIQGRTVLIVDQLNDTREVLRTVLESVGLRTMEAEQADEGLELAQQHSPDVVVLDEESGNAPLQTWWAVEDERWGSVPIVVLGKARWQGRRVAVEQSENGRCYLPKPFHYVDLIRTIEELLSSGSGTSAATA